MMDERLISEVQKHAIIYNRQKNNMINGDKSANKEMAWTKIALNLGTDPDSCKKRWKYLRERYVQQKKVGDSPSYEHLSRPYLEKMRFLDHFIQPRKSYRNVGHLLTSPNNSQQSLMDGSSNDESTKLERTIQMSQMLQNFHADAAGIVENVANASLQHLNPLNHTGLGIPAPENEETSFNHYYRLNLAATNNRIPEPIQNHQSQHNLNELRLNSAAATPDLIKNELIIGGQSTMPSSSSSSLVSSQTSPTIGNNSTTETHNDVIENGRKRRRTLEPQHRSANGGGNERGGIQAISINSNLHHHHRHTLSSDADADEERQSTNNDDADNDDMHQSSAFASDFLYPFYQHTQRRQQQQQQQQQQQPQHQQFVRNSEQLLGELVTSELLKMSKERKKVAQKKILEILFFND